MTIIHNGFALFSGNPGGGESLIRQYVIENDWLEDIIQLSNDLFYNTEISTYIWIITKINLQNVKEKYNSLTRLICMKIVIKYR